jgi:hypothetical protein
MKLNLKQKCVKIGMKQVNATMVKNVNLRMVDMSYKKNLFKIPIDIKVRSATVIMF